MNELMQSQIFQFFNIIIGYAIIFVAVDFNRPNDKIEPFSKNWWIVIFLVSLGAYVLDGKY